MREKTEEYTINLMDKIAYRNPNRKSNAVSFEITIGYDVFERPIFSASVQIWNNWHSGIVAGGQCFDEIYKFRDKVCPRDRYIIDTIYGMWKKYHLNDMRAGTPLQEEYIKKMEEQYGRKLDYDETCAVLKDAGLYEVEYHSLEFDGMYKYGHAWLYQPIPKLDWQVITILCKDFSVVDA